MNSLHSDISSSGPINKYKFENIAENYSLYLFVNIIVKAYHR